MIRRLIPLAAFACLAAPAMAQDDPAIDMSGDTFTIGAGVGYTTDYEGADEYKIIPGGALRGKVSGHNFFMRGLQFYVDAIPENDGALDLSFGPVVGLRLNRTGDVKDDRVEALGELNTAYEVGAYAGISKSGILTSPYDTLGFRVTYLKDVGNAHESHIIQPSIEYGMPLSRKAYVGLGLSADFVGDGYANYYFDVTPDGAAASGLSPFEAEGGFKSWNANILATHVVSGDLLNGFSIFGIGSYTRLRGDFARSSIVSEAGSSNQWFGAIGVAYTF